jgi:hypothetical protein
MSVSECGICYQDSILEKSSPCNHECCIECWTKSLAKQYICPFCRGKINSVTNVVLPSVVGFGSNNGLGSNNGYIFSSSNGLGSNNGYIFSSSNGLGSNNGSIFASSNGLGSNNGSIFGSNNGFGFGSSNGFRRNKELLSNPSPIQKMINPNTGRLILIGGKTHKTLSVNGDIKDSISQVIKK